MEKLQYEFAAGPPAAGRALTGVVSSGDLEVLLEPGTSGRTTVLVHTSVNGFGAVWQALLAVEGAFQGGSMGEVGGAKIAGALELAAQDNRSGVPTQAVILFETGGVRLQEANLGLAAIAEIQAAIVDLRRYRPVIGVSA